MLGRRTKSPINGGKYERAYFGCTRNYDGALRADHTWLFETARMVIANRSEEVNERENIINANQHRGETCARRSRSAAQRRSRSWPHLQRPLRDGFSLDVPRNAIRYLDR